MSKIVRTIVSPTGKVSVKVIGVAGEKCREISAPFVAAFSGNKVSDTPTAEASLPAETIETEAEREQQ